MQFTYPWLYPWEHVKRKKAQQWAWWAWFDVIMACMCKDITSALADRISLFQMVILPLNYNMLLILFALVGSAAPTAVVMRDTGPYAQRFYDAMNASHSFRLQVVSSEAEAQASLLHGDIVAVVTIPADFDQKVGLGQPVQV